MADNEISKVDTFVDQLAKGNNAEAGDAFKDALRSKVGDALDQRRKDMASAMFNGQAMPHSDNKPQVATPGQFNQDGTITNADGTDGKSAEELSAETKPEVAEPSADTASTIETQPEAPAEVETPAEAPAEAPATEQ